MLNMYFRPKMGGIDIVGHRIDCSSVLNFSIFYSTNAKVYFMFSFDHLTYAKRHVCCRVSGVNCQSALYIVLWCYMYSLCTLQYSCWLLCVGCRYRLGIVGLSCRYQLYIEVWIVGTVEELNCKRPIQCLAPSKMLTHHPLTARWVCTGAFGAGGGKEDNKEQPTSRNLSVTQGFVI